MPQAPAAGSAGWPRPPGIPGLRALWPTPRMRAAVYTLLEKLAGCAAGVAEFIETGLDRAQAWRTGSGRRLAFTDDITWRWSILLAEKQVFTATQAMVKKSGTARGRYSGIKASDKLLVFLPELIQNAISRGCIKKDDWTKAAQEDLTETLYDPVISSFEAVVVFADASGFTALTERLAKQPHGAEEIGDCLNNFFGGLIAIVASFGGDVLKFSGDAITILWPIAQNPKGTVDRIGAVMAACQCCLEVQKQVQNFGHTPVDGVTLTLHIGMGFGQLTTLQIGGLLDRWEFCTAGVPFEEVAIAEPLAKPGETVVSPSVRKVLAETKDRSKRNCFSFKELQAKDGYALLASGSSVAPSARASNTPEKSERRVLLSLDQQLVGRYVPAAAMRSFLKNQTHLDPEPEMRRVSVIFLNIRGLEPGSNRSDAGRTQRVFKVLQRSCYAFEGSINKFLVDDKGMLLLCVFGLPPVSHYDDPLRAVLAGERFCNTLAEECLDGRVGVATGTVWCGTVGSASRREYTVLGDTVNLSARLMAQADANTVRVDHATFQACKQTLLFQELGLTSVKGKQDQIQIYRFSGRLLPRKDRESRQISKKLCTWRLWPARTRLLESLERQLRHPQGPGGVVYVHGGPGRGKTELVEDIKAWAKQQDFCILAGQNQNPTGTFSIPRLCWQEVFDRLLTEARTNPKWRRASSRGTLHLLRELLLAAGAGEDLLEWMPLLRLVVPQLDFGPNVVNAMVDRDELHAASRPLRMVTLCQLLMQAFNDTSASKGTVVLLHCRRSTSFFQETSAVDGCLAKGLAELATQHRYTGGKPLILCVVAREAMLPSQEIVGMAKQLGGFVHVTNFSYQETQEYMAHWLGSPAGVDSRLASYVYETSGGNPLGIDILCKNLQKNGVLRCSPEGWAEPASGWEGPDRLRTLPYPDVLIGMATASFEVLTHDEQAIVKNAAVCSQEADSDFSMTVYVADLAFTLGMPLEKVAEGSRKLVALGIFREAQEVVPPSGTRRGLSLLKRSHTTASGRACEHASPQRDDSRIVEFSAIAFFSELHRHVALSLVLKSRQDKIHNQLQQGDDEEEEDDTQSEEWCNNKDRAGLEQLQEEEEDAGEESCCADANGRSMQLQAVMDRQASEKGRKPKPVN